MTPADIDAALLRVRAGEREAFELAFTACYRQVRLATALRCPDAELVDAAVQEAFVTAYERLDEYEQRGTFAAWVAGIASNRLARALRARGRQRQVDLAMADVMATHAEAVTPVDVELQQRVRQCLEVLPPAVRQLAWWRFAERRAVTDIAAVLGRSAPSVSVSIHRLRRALGDCLRRDGLHG